AAAPTLSPRTRPRRGAAADRTRGACLPDTPRVARRPPTAVRPGRGPPVHRAVRPSADGCVPGNTGRSARPRRPRGSTPPAWSAPGRDGRSSAAHLLHLVPAVAGAPGTGSPGFQISAAPAGYGAH